MSINQYLELIKKFPLRPIRTDKEFDAASKVLNELRARADENWTKDQCDYMEVLERMVWNYEASSPSTPSRTAEEARKESIKEYDKWSGYLDYELNPRVISILAVEAKAMRIIRSLAKTVPSADGLEWIIRFPIRGDRLDDALWEASDIEDDIKIRAEIEENEKKYGKML